VPAMLARKIAAAKKETAKARAGKNSFPPTPFLFARPSVIFRSRPRDFLENEFGLFLTNTTKFDLVQKWRRARVVYVNFQKDMI